MKIFTEENYQAYVEEDDYWEGELAPLVKKHKSKAVLYKGVVIYQNYIPLYRIGTDEDLFEEAEPGMLYIWNYSDFSDKRFNQIVKEITQAEDIKGREVVVATDPGGL